MEHFQTLVVYLVCFVQFVFAQFNQGGSPLGQQQQQWPNQNQQQQQWNQNQQQQFGNQAQWNQNQAQNYPEILNPYTGGCLQPPNSPDTSQFQNCVRAQSVQGAKCPSYTCNFPLQRPGYCPQLTGEQSPTGECRISCTSDFMCTDHPSLKCCPNGCGLTCQMPVFSDAPPDTCGAGSWQVWPTGVPPHPDNAYSPDPNNQFSGVQNTNWNHNQWLNQGAQPGFSPSFIPQPNPSMFIPNQGSSNPYWPNQNLQQQNTNQNWPQTPNRGPVSGQSWPPQQQSTTWQNPNPFNNPNPQIPPQQTPSWLQNPNLAWNRAGGNDTIPKSTSSGTDAENKADQAKADKPKSTANTGEAEKNIQIEKLPKKPLIPDKDV